MKHEHLPGQSGVRDGKQGEIWSLLPHINLKVKMSFKAVMADVIQIVVKHLDWVNA